MYADYKRSSSDAIPYFSSGYNEPIAPAFKPIKRRLLVDYRDRDSGSPFDFTVKLGASGVEPYQHVTSVELKLLALPKIASESYAIIDIKELNDSLLDATNNAANRSFAVGFFDSSILSAGDIKPIKDFYSQKIIFNPPLQTLDRLSVRVLKQNGNVVSTSETANVSDVSMLLEVETNARRV